MNVKELRIGNYISVRNDVRKVNSVSGSPRSERISTTIDGCNFAECHFSEDSIRPIPLSKEWLVKLGFTTYTINKWDFPIENDDYYHIVKFKGWNFRGLGYTMCKIEYVHQLQNLYFALTGKELEVVNES